MNQSRPSSLGRSSLPTAIAWPVGLWAAGLLASFWPTWTSGFGLIQGGLGDTRLVNFVLEHSYRWLLHLPLAEHLFSPPIFFPVRGTAFYTDLLLGVAPLYWVWRFIGADPHTAYQLWMLCCWSLNFLAAHLLLERGLGLERPGAAAGAYLFAFGSPRLANMAHQQLNPQFLLLASLGAAIALTAAGGRARTGGRARLWIAVLFAGLLLQLATAIYPLLFLAIAAVAGLAAAIALPDVRHALARVLRAHWLPLLATALITVALALPIAAGYAGVAGELGTRPYMVEKLPRPLSWLLPGSSNLLYGWVHRLPGFAWSNTPTHQNGVGIATLALAAAGLWRGRRRKAVQLTIVAALALFLLTLRMPGDWSLWRWAREAIPFATGVRAVGRAGAVLLYPAALGVALAVERLASRRRWLAIAAVALVAAEQLHAPPAFRKAAVAARIESIAAAVPPDATAFLLVGALHEHDRYLHDDAAWVAFASGVPTVNGRSGLAPRRWMLANLRRDGALDDERIHRSLARWCRTRGLDPAGIAWLVAPRDAPDRRSGG